MAVVNLRNFGPITLRALGFQTTGGVRYFSGAVVPVDGASGTGATQAGPGSVYVYTTDGSSYINVGTKAAPLWSKQGGETKFCTTQFDAVTGTTGVTLTNIVGLTSFTLAAAGVYKVEAHIAGVSTANCGIKLGFKLTTTTLTSLEVIGRGFTAAAVAVQHTTTAADQASLFAQTAAVINVHLSGRIIVNAGGTIALQAAQNAAHADTTTVYVGSWMTLTRIS